jgi:hypothetical protein
MNSGGDLYLPPGTYTFGIDELRGAQFSITVDERPRSNPEFIGWKRTPDLQVPLPTPIPDIELYRSGRITNPGSLLEPAPVTNPPACRSGSAGNS